MMKTITMNPGTLAQDIASSSESYQRFRLALRALHLGVLLRSSSFDEGIRGA
jgi:hypothetical protein